MLASLLACDTSVPNGTTEIRPGDPKITKAVERVVLPLLQDLNPDEIRRTEMGDLLARFGPATPGGLLIQTYVVAQHANLSSDTPGEIVPDGTPFGIEGRAAVGRGASQIKGPMAAAFEATGGVDRGALTRPLWLAVNTEGMSSHEGSRRLFSMIDGPLAGCIVSIGTDLRVSLGNRGRVDVDVIVRGDAFHSSQPWLGSNAIESAVRVVGELGHVPVPPEHPALGPASITPYSISCHPIAPHTVPSSVTITIDRRLLPGENPEQAAAELAEHLERGGAVKVRRGKHMLPVIVDEGEVLVGDLREGLRSAGRIDACFHSSNAFDAGYAFSLGIPTVMFGPGRRRFSGEGLLGIDALSVEDCTAAARTLAFTAQAFCSRS